MGKDTLNLRVDENVKSNAEKVLDELGLSMTAAVTLYLKAIVRTQSIPFSLSAVSANPSIPIPQDNPKADSSTGRSDLRKQREAAKTTEREKKDAPGTNRIKGTTSFKNAIDKL